MPGRTKKFIDKKNAVKFHLVHRSQRDPLQADDEAPQRVLLQESETEVRQVEQRKFGVFFDDEYDYLQHLKDTDELYNDKQELKNAWIPSGPVSSNSVNLQEPEREPVQSEEAKLKLSSRMFASAVETDVGLLNKAAPAPGPKLDWDPDIVAALDDDFEFDDPDNVLEDDFMEIANAEEGPENRMKEKDGDGEYDSDDMTGSLENGSEEYDSDPGDLYMDEEVKSRFTNYSMTSSVIRRNKELTLLDDRFEQMFANYDEDEIGALEDEDIVGGMDVNGQMLQQLVEEFTNSEKPTLAATMDNQQESVRPSNNMAEEPVQMEEQLVVEQDPGQQWDCESILSTYSNLYNRPKLIVEARKGKPRKKAEDEVPVLEEGVQAEMSCDRVCTYRPKDETTEERQQRKQAVKQERRARREEKKANKMAFKTEEQRQHQEHLNLQHNLKNIKLI